MVNKLLENCKRRRSGKEYTTVAGNRVAGKSPPTAVSIIFIIKHSY